MKTKTVFEFTTKRARQESNSDCSLASERREQIQRRAGFTLVETLVAVSILTLSISGPLYSASRALVAAQISRDQLTASSLAQEGIEYVRMMRDNEYLALYPTGTSAAAWNNFLTGSDAASITGCITSTCTLDTYPGVPMGTGASYSLKPCAGNACGPLFLTNCSYGASGLTCTPPNLYTQQILSGSVQTLFTRTVQATAVSANEEKIISTVTWTFHGTPHTITAIDHLTSWQ